MDMKRTLLAMCALACPGVSPALGQGPCFEAAAARYQIPAELLVAIARTESGLRADAIGRNEDGSEDLGLMQINSWWLPHLARYGLTREDLTDPCTNVEVGAWILAQEIRRFGYGWEAVGAYNAGPAPDSAPARRRYAAQVARRMEVRP